MVNINECNCTYDVPYIYGKCLICETLIKWLFCSLLWSICVIHGRFMTLMLVKISCVKILFFLLAAQCKFVFIKQVIECIILGASATTWRKQENRSVLYLRIPHQHSEWIRTIFALGVVLPNQAIWNKMPLINMIWLFLHAIIQMKTHTHTFNQADSNIKSIPMIK